MFSMDVIDTDHFLEMPTSTQLLYFHLALRADDDGFISSPKRILRLTGASEDDMRMLLAKEYVIPFSSGVCVIRHWKIHNYIQSDRYHETIYKDEKKQLSEDENKVYSLDTQCIQDVSKTDTQVRLGKVSQVKVSKGKDSRNFMPPTTTEVKDYANSIGFTALNPEYFKDYYESKGWMIGKNKMKDWKAAVRTWKRREKDNGTQQPATDSTDMMFGGFGNG